MVSREKCVEFKLPISNLLTQPNERTHHMQNDKVLLLAQIQIP